MVGGTRLGSRIRPDRPLDLLCLIQEVARIRDKRVVGGLVGAARHAEIPRRHVAEMICLAVGITPASAKPWA